MTDKTTVAADKLRELADQLHIMQQPNGEWFILNPDGTRWNDVAYPSLHEASVAAGWKKP